MVGLFRSVGFSESAPLQLEETSNSRWGGFVYTVTKHLLFHQQVTPHRLLFIPNMSKKKKKKSAAVPVLLTIGWCGLYREAVWWFGWREMVLLFAAECSSRGGRVSPYSNWTEGRRAEVKDGRISQTASSQTVGEWCALVVHIKTMFNWTFSVHRYNHVLLLSAAWPKMDKYLLAKLFWICKYLKMAFTEARYWDLWDF